MILSRHGRSSGRQAPLMALGSALLAVALIGIIPTVSDASSHREAPLIADDPPLDNTDLYAFVSPDQPDTVTFIANWQPFSEPNGGPNFYPWSTNARHDINIDSNGDAEPDVIYRWTFSTDDRRGTDTFLYNNGPVESLDDENLLFRQTFTLSRIEGDQETEMASGPVAPSFTGPAGMPDYAALREEAITDLDGGGMTYAGQADDPFFLDLRVFDLLYGGDLSETGVDTLAGYNVNTVALQVPIDEVALNNDPDANPAIGVWTTTSTQSVDLSAGAEEFSGDFVQVSRLGMPLVNEVVVPAGLKDAFNSLPPSMDAEAADGAVLDKVLNPELPMLIEQIYGIEAPETPRTDIQQIFLTGIAEGTEGPVQQDLNSQLINADVNDDEFVPSEMLRLNLTIPPTAEPSRLGVLGEDLQGFPNGRRLADDVVDIEIQALVGAVRTGEIVQPLAAGDGVNANDNAFSDTFPYVALPNMVSVNQTSGGAMPQGGVETGAGGAAAALAAPAATTTASLPAWVLATGSAGLLLLAAGMVALARGRRRGQPVLHG
jgi:hypothetical protein